MIRRAFLRWASAAAVAALVSVETLRTNFPHAEERAWLWQEFTGFNRTILDEHGGVWVGYLTAQRSDGTHFYVSVMEPADLKFLEHKDAWGLRVREDMEAAAKQLDSFRDCACQVGFRCPEHFQEVLA